MAENDHADEGKTSSSEATEVSNPPLVPKESWFTLARAESVVLPIVLLIIFSFLLLSIMNSYSPTIDEIPTLAWGYAQLKERAIVDDERPALGSMIAALPLFGLDVGGIRDLTKSGSARQFLYSSESGGDTLVWWGRFVIAVLCVLVGIVLYFWARELYSPRAGWYALFLYVFSIPVLAYSALALNEVVFSAFAVFFLYSFWKSLGSRNRWWVLASAVCLGGAMGSSFIGIWLWVSALLLVIIRFLIKNEDLFTFGYNFLNAVLIVLMAIFIVSLAYGGRIDIYLHKVFNPPSLGAPYLSGESSNSGFWYYYLVLFGTKTALPFFLILALALYETYTLIRKQPYYEEAAGVAADELSVLFPLFILLLVLSLNSVQVGLHQILFAFALLAIFSSKIILESGMVKYIAIGVFSLLYVGVAVFAHPQYLGYTNLFVQSESPYLGYNIDAGQYATQVVDYLDASGVSKAYVGYPGADIGRYDSIKCFPIPGITIVGKTVLWEAESKNDTCLNWLSLYRPVDQIESSILVYNISGTRLNLSNEFESLVEYMDKHNIQNLTLSPLGPRAVFYELDTRQQYLGRVKKFDCTLRDGWLAVIVDQTLPSDRVDQVCHQWMSETTPMEKIGYATFLYQIKTGGKEIRLLEGKREKATIPVVSGS